MKRNKDTLFKPSVPRAETLLDKTTRLAQEIIDDDTEKRRQKTARLRKARLDMEAETAAEETKATADEAGKKSKAKPKAKTKPKSKS